MPKMHKIYHLTWNDFSISTKPYSINNWQLTHLLALKRITSCRFMENNFLNHEPERFAMKQFCDLLCNIIDRNIAKSQHCKVASSPYRIITLPEYRNIAISQDHDIWKFSLICFLRNAICETCYRISLVLKYFTWSDIWCIWKLWRVTSFFGVWSRIAISQS